MKKIFSAILCLFSVVTVAQNRPVSIIVQGGFQGANITTKDKDGSNKMNPGYRVGLGIDYTLGSSLQSELSIQSGIYFSQKGTKSKEEIHGVSHELKTNLLYLDVPVLANARFLLGDGLNFFVNAGPYAGFGISGKETDATKEFGLELKQNLFEKQKGADKAAFKRFDLGLHVGAGVEIHRFMLGVGTQYGLLNISNNKDHKASNVSFFTTLGYRF